MRTRACQLPTVGVIKSTLPVSNFRARPQPTPPTLRGREVGPTSIPTLREGRILYPIRGTTPARTQHRSRYLDRLFGDKPEVEAKAKRPATLPPCPTVSAHTPPSISVRVNGDKTWRCARTLRPVLPPSAKTAPSSSAHKKGLPQEAFSSFVRKKKRPPPGAM